jgi:hypothetical protein
MGREFVLSLPYPSKLAICSTLFGFYRVGRGGFTYWRLFGKNLVGGVNPTACLNK